MYQLSQVYRTIIFSPQSFIGVSPNKFGQYLTQQGFNVEPEGKGSYDKFLHKITIPGKKTFWLAYVWTQGTHIGQYLYTIYYIYVDASIEFERDQGWGSANVANTTISDAMKY